MRGILLADCFKQIKQTFQERLSEQTIAFRRLKGYKSATFLHDVRKALLVEEAMEVVLKYFLATFIYGIYVIVLRGYLESVLESLIGLLYHKLRDINKRLGSLTHHGKCGVGKHIYD